MKVRSDRPLALLHAKFWGRSMVDEEQVWCNSQPLTLAIGNESRDKDQDGDEFMDKCSDRTVDEGQGTDLDDDDIIPGCYLLDIGIEGLNITKLWVRAEYIRVYDFIEYYHKNPSFPRERAPAVVVTGQPGIGMFSSSPFLSLILTKRHMVKGKSVWIHYALRRRLAESKPVIWYREQTCYLFTQEGVYEAPPGHKPSFFKTFVWTLVDSDESKDGVPPQLVPHGTRHFVIYTTSPHKDRWLRLRKTVRSTLVTMNPWTRAEILQM